MKQRKARLFGSRLSPFVEKVARALLLKRVTFELAEPRGPFDFVRWSPQTGKMPVLEVDGERVCDSTFICRRLDELVSTPRSCALELAPFDPELQHDGAQGSRLQILASPVR